MRTPVLMGVAGFARRRIEGLVWLALLPFLCAALLLASAGGAGRGSSWRPFLSRWLEFVRHGFRQLREAWWVQCTYESAAVVWRYVLLHEAFALRNLRSARDAQTNGRALVVNFGHVGDLLLTVPLLRMQCAQGRYAGVDLLVGPWCRELAERLPYQNRVWCHGPAIFQFHRGHRSWRVSLGQEWRTFNQIRNEHYAAVFFAGRFALVETALLEALRPPRWRGHGDRPDVYGGRAPELLPYAAGVHHALRLVRLAEPAAGAKEAWPLEYHLPADADTERGRLLRRLGVPDGIPLVGVVPGGGWPGKLWPAERFAALTRMLVATSRCVVLVLGTMGESELAARIYAGGSESVINLTGRTTWDELALVCSGCALIVANDTGTLHLAAALGIPTLGLFGPTRPDEWAPRHGPHVTLRGGAGCPHCYSWRPDAPCAEPQSCMEELGVELVFEAAQHQLMNSRGVAPWTSTR